MERKIYVDEQSTDAKCLLESAVTAECRNKVEKVLQSLNKKESLKELMGSLKNLLTKVGPKGAGILKAEQEKDSSNIDPVRKIWDDMIVRTSDIDFKRIASGKHRIEPGVNFGKSFNNKEVLSAIKNILVEIHDKVKNEEARKEQESFESDLDLNI